jgi:hypothetical protein
MKGESGSGSSSTASTLRGELCGSDALLGDRLADERLQIEPIEEIIEALLNKLLQVFVRGLHRVTREAVFIDQHGYGEQDAGQVEPEVATATAEPQDDRTKLAGMPAYVAWNVYVGATLHFIHQQIA